MLLQFDTYYHIFNHANGDDNLFREEKNYPFFLNKYHEHIEPIAHTIAWCLMPNHFHLLIKIRKEEEILDFFSSSDEEYKNSSKVANFRRVLLEGEEEEKSKQLSRQFSNFFSSYTQAFNKVYQRRGSLFLKTFKRKEVEDDSYFYNLIFYIHLNPVKHGFVQNHRNWDWSSFHNFPKEQGEIVKRLFSSEKAFFSSHDNKTSSFDQYDKLEDDLT